MDGPLKRTPLFEQHRALGAKMVPFGGWEMPVQYPTGIIKEHKTVRSAVGLFDVSHMGEASLRGPNAPEAALMKSAPASSVTIGPRSACRKPKANPT